MIKWINEKYGLALTEDKIEEIKNFSLLWNIYENRICDTNFSISTIEEKYHSKEFNTEEFEPLFEYFKQRYTDDDVINHRFSYLRFRRSDRQEFVEQVLVGVINDIDSRMLAMSIIVYRYRNNLFHGLKDFRLIEEQNANFEQANKFLMLVLNNF